MFLPCYYKPNPGFPGFESFAFNILMTSFFLWSLPLAKTHKANHVCPPSLFIMKLKLSLSSISAFELRISLRSQASNFPLRDRYRVPLVYECSQSLALESLCRKPDRSCDCPCEFLSFLVIKEQFCKAKGTCGLEKVSINHKSKKKVPQNLYIKML